MNNFAVRLRKWVFSAIGILELAVTVLLISLATGMPKRAQITTSFTQAKGTGRRAQIAAAMFHNKLVDLSKIPVVGRSIDQRWLDGMADARQELDRSVSDLDVYEEQICFVCATVCRIIYVVAVIVALHGLYLILASVYGIAYSP
jgi:hypothetical protein